MGCGPSDNSNHIRTITFVGLEGSGKSNIVFHLVTTNPKNYEPLPTPGVEYHEFDLDASSFRIYDCGGISRYRSQWPYYIKRSQGVVFVIDRSDKDRMGRVQEEIKIVLEICQQLKLPILILINKSDLSSSISTKDYIKITKVDDYDVDYDIKNCCAKTGSGIEEGKNWLLKHINSKTPQTGKTVDDDTDGLELSDKVEASQQSVSSQTMSKSEEEESIVIEEEESDSD